MITDKELFKLSCAVAEENIPFCVNLKTDTQWALIQKDGINILAFPYTVSKLDWMQNFDFLKIPYKNMNKIWFVHRGFLNKYKSIRNDILNVTKNLTSLTITGFSQGGALALLAFEDIKFNYPKINLNGISFGAPKVIGWLAPKTRWIDFVRYTVNGDPVPMLPPFIFGYKHIGYHIKLGKRRIIPKITYHTESYEGLL